MKTDDRLGIKAGEIYEVTTYQLDSEKVVLYGRVPDGYDPYCTQYKDEIEFLKE